MGPLIIARRCVFVLYPYFTGVTQFEPIITKIER